MNCESFRSNIFAYTENDFSSFQVEEFVRHSGVCFECSKLLDEFKQTLTIIEQDKKEETDPFAETRLLQKLENYQEKENWWYFPVPKLVLHPVYLSIGVAIALLLGVILGFEQSGYHGFHVTESNGIESIRTELNVPIIMGEDVIQLNQ